MLRMNFLKLLDIHWTPEEESEDEEDEEDVDED